MAYSIPLDYLNEGQQAEEYKARKAKEAADKEAVENERSNRRYKGLEDDNHVNFVGNKTNKSDIRRSFRDENLEKKVWDSRSDDERRANKAAHIANKAGLRGDSFNKGFDAVNRNMRRHPENYKEFSLFENVLFI